jgi:hypothetical protein
VDRSPSNLILGTFTKVCEENPNLFKIGQKCHKLYVKTHPGFVVEDEIHLPKSTLFK